MPIILFKKMSGPLVISIFNTFPFPIHRLVQVLMKSEMTNGPKKKKVLDNLSNEYYNQPPHNLTSMSFDRCGARTRKTREDSTKSPKKESDYKVRSSGKPEIQDLLT